MKTFFADGPGDAGAARRPIETRIIRRVDSDDPFKQWEFAVYAWNPAGDDARLLDLQARTPVEVTVQGARFTHQIPSRDDCGKCHEANDTIPIGFDETRLAWRPAGADRTELRRFFDLGLLAGAPPERPALVEDAREELRQLNSCSRRRFPLPPARPGRIPRRTRSSNGCEPGRRASSIGRLASTSGSLPPWAAVTAAGSAFTWTPSARSSAA